MRWSRLKTAVIVLLLAANVFFALKIVDLSRDRTDEITGETDAAIIEVLKNEGIVMPEKLLWRAGNVTAFICNSSGDYTAPLREKLTGTTEWVYDRRDGSVRTIQVGDGSKFTFGSGCAFEMLRLEYDTVVDAALGDAASADVSAETASAVELLLGEIFVPDGSVDALSLSTDRVRKSEGTGCIIAEISQKIEYSDANTALSSALYGNRLTCVILDGSLIYASGKWLFSPVTEVKTARQADTVNILLSVKKAVSGRADVGHAMTVTDIGHTYCAYANIQSGIGYIMPGCVAVFSDGEKYVVNAVSAELYE